MNRINLFGDKSQEQKLRPPQLKIQTKQFSKLTPPPLLESNKKIKIQTNVKSNQKQKQKPKMNNSLLKQKKQELKKQQSSPEFNLMHRDTVTSIQVKEDMQQLQSPYPQMKGFSNNHSINNKYLSIISLPQDYQFRPSKASIQRQYRKWQGDDNQKIMEKCDQCQYQGQMEFIYKLGWVGWSWIVFLFLATFIFFWIPIVLKSFKSKEIICPQCGNQVGIQKPTCL